MRRSGLFNVRRDFLFWCSIRTLSPQTYRTMRTHEGIKKEGFTPSEIHFYWIFPCCFFVGLVVFMYILCCFLVYSLLAKYRSCCFLVYSLLFLCCLCCFFVYSVLFCYIFLVVFMLFLCCFLVGKMLFFCWSCPQNGISAEWQDTHLYYKRILLGRSPKTLKRPPALRIRAGDKFKHRVPVHIQIENNCFFEVLEAVKLAFFIVCIRA